MALLRLSELIDQADATGFLRSVVIGGRYGNAYLLHGPAGVGKGSAALAFARALLCQKTPGGAPATGDLFAAAEPAGPMLDDACGVCPACVKTGDLQHPDLKFVFPVIAEDQKLEETIADVMQAVREDPLYVFAYEKAASIRLVTTRELLRELAFQPYEAPRRVVVVRDADRMREDQYSALLKAIEEPGATTVWVLTTSRLARLPATIRSRCQRVRFAPLPEESIVRFLEEKAEMKRKDAALLAALAGGNLGKALVLRDVDFDDVRDQALQLVDQAVQGNPAGLWKAAQSYMNYGRTGRETLRRMIEFHMLWLRDLMRAQVGAPAELLVHRDREKDIREQAAKVTPTEIRRRLLALEEALQSIEGNVSPDLTIFSAMVRVGGRRIGEGQWPAHAAARSDY
jgi:DNA polymerase III subunit delta'